jgi:hypothetical protein
MSSVLIEMKSNMKLYCNECDGDLELALQKNQTLYIEPCKNCCKEIFPFTGKCYDCEYVGDLQCLLQHGDNLDGKCIYFKQKN